MSPESPITPLAANAAGIHELFRTYVDAGFTEAQAIQLLCAHIRAAAGPNDA